MKTDEPTSERPQHGESSPGGLPDGAVNGAGAVAYPAPATFLPELPVAKTSRVLRLIYWTVWFVALSPR